MLKKEAVYCQYIYIYIYLKADRTIVVHCHFNTVMWIFNQFWVTTTWKLDYRIIEKKRTNKDLAKRETYVWSLVIPHLLQWKKFSLPPVLPKQPFRTQCLKREIDRSSRLITSFQINGTISTFYALRVTSPHNATFFFVILKMKPSSKMCHNSKDV